MLSSLLVRLEEAKYGVERTVWIRLYRTRTKRPKDGRPYMIGSLEQSNTLEMELGGKWKKRKPGQRLRNSAPEQMLSVEINYQRTKARLRFSCKATSD